MVQSINYRFGFGLGAPAGSNDNNISNVVKRPAFMGAAKRLLDRLGGSYTPYQKGRFYTIYHTLVDEGILAKLDMLCIRGLTEADSLLNWAAASGSAVNFGATLVPGTGFTFNGTSHYIDTVFTPVKYKAGDACMFGYLPTGVGTSAMPLMGRGSSVSNRQIYPTGSSDTVATARINTETSLSVAYTGSRIGLWSADELAGVQSIRHDGTSLGSSSLAASPTVSNGLLINRVGASTYGAWTVSAWGYGAYLTPAQDAILAAAIKAMHAVI